MPKRKLTDTEIVEQLENERYACILIDKKAATVLEVVPRKYEDEPDSRGEPVLQKGATVGEMKTRLDGLNVQAISATLLMLEAHGLIEVVVRTWRGIEQNEYPLKWRRTQAGSLACIATMIHEEDFMKDVERSLSARMERRKDID